MAEPLYVNKDGENVEAIAKRLMLPVSLRYLGVPSSSIEQIVEQKEQRKMHNSGTKSHVNISPNKLKRPLMKVGG